MIPKKKELTVPITISSVTITLRKRFAQNGFVNI
jgi:hypothetical protein